jgi:hypothetical protein
MSFQVRRMSKLRAGAAAAVGCVCALAAGILIGDCGGGDPKLSTGQLEREIRAEFEKGAEDATGYLKITGVRCVRMSPSEATCQVEGEEGDAFGMYRLSTVDLVVDIDPDTGEYQWREAG